MSLLLNKFADLTTKDDFKEVIDSILELNSEVDKLTSKISELEPCLSAAEENISKDEADVKELKNQVGGVTQANEEELLAEMSEGSRRLHNVIIKNVPEGNQRNPDDKKSHDLDIVTRIHTILNLHLSDIISFFRLGKSGNKNRPIKFVFTDVGNAMKLLKRFSAEELAQADDRFSEISISHDRTQKERLLLNELRQTLDRRTKSGESNLTIKYVIGIPKIVNNTPKN